MRFASLIFLILLLPRDLNAAARKNRPNESPVRPCPQEVDLVTAAKRLGAILREEDSRIAEYLLGRKPGVKTLWQYLFDYPSATYDQVKTALNDGVRGELRRRMIDDELPPGPDFLDHRVLPTSIAEALAADAMVRQLSAQAEVGVGVGPALSDSTTEPEPEPAVVETIPESTKTTEKSNRPRNPLLVFSDEPIFEITGIVAAVDAINRYEHYLVNRFGHCQLEQIPPVQVGTNRPGLPPLDGTHLPERFGVLGQRWEEFQIFDGRVGRVDEKDRVEPPPPERVKERVAASPSKRDVTFQILWGDFRPGDEEFAFPVPGETRAGRTWEQVSEQTRIKQMAFLREFVSQMQAFDDYLTEFSDEREFDAIEKEISLFEKSPPALSALRVLSAKHKLGRGTTIRTLLGWLPELIDLRVRMCEIRPKITFNLEARGPVAHMEQQYEDFRSFLRDHRPSLLYNFEDVSVAEVRGILPPLDTDEAMAARFNVGIGRLHRIRSQKDNETLAANWLQFSNFHSRVMRHRHRLLLSAVPGLRREHWAFRVNELADAFELPPEDVRRYPLKKASLPVSEDHPD